MVLRSHFTTAAQDALSLLRSQLKEKVLETIREAETLGHRRSTTRGVHDGSAPEEMLQNLSVSAEELNVRSSACRCITEFPFIMLFHFCRHCIKESLFCLFLQAMEQQICADFLQSELKRTRLITVCFTNAHSIQEVESVSESNTRYYSTRSMNTASSTFNHRTTISPGSSLSRHRRLLSASSLSDSDSGKPSIVHPSQSPLSQSGYASSDLGSETGVNEMQLRSSATSERYVKTQGDIRRQSRRAVFGTADDDFR